MRITFRFFLHSGFPEQNNFELKTQTCAHEKRIPDAIAAPIFIHTHSATPSKVTGIVSGFAIRIRLIVIVD